MATCAQGHENLDGHRFCGTCGEQLGSSADPGPSGGEPTALASRLAGDAGSPSGADADVRSVARRPLQRTKVLAAAGAVVVVGVVAALALTASSGSSERTARILYTLTDMEDFLDPSVDGDDILRCEGAGGYRDFSAGMGVRVTDGEGKTIGSASMRNADSHDEIVEYAVGAGQAEDADAAQELVDLLESTGVGCILLAEMELPDSDFYELEIGSRRGSITYSHDELAERNWYFTPSLGG